MEWVNGELHWNPILLDKLNIRWMKFWNIFKMTSIQLKLTRPELVHWCGPQHSSIDFTSEVIMEC